MEADAHSQTIRLINKGVVHRICAGQVILDLSSAVKELVENSLDAGATSIEIALKEYGQESFQVIDNGCGISPSNFKVLALKHHTSKLSDFHDLQSLTTFGFRGEALSSLCALGHLTVETRTKNESVATHLTFDHSGLLTAEKKTARQIGTTVTVRKLFSNLPVRSKEFSRNIRKEYGKLISLLNAYALIARGVRLVCTNTTGKNVKSIVLNTQGRGSLKDNIITVFGMNTFNCLEPLDICISDGCKVEGFLSKSGQGSGRNLGDRQYFFINGRPVDMPKVSKLVNELYKGANSRQYPIAVMNFTIPSKACDVNVTPDKRKVFLSDENSFLFALREGLRQIYSSSNANYSVNKVEEHTNDADIVGLCTPHLSKQLPSGDNDPKNKIEKLTTASNTPLRTSEVKAFNSHVESNDNSVETHFALRVHGSRRADTVLGYNTGEVTNHVDNTTDRNASSSFNAVEEVVVVNRNPNSHSNRVQSSIEKFVTVNKRKLENVVTILSELPVLRNQSPLGQLNKQNSETPVVATRLPVKHHRLDDSINEHSKFLQTNKMSNEIGNQVSIGGTINSGNPEMEVEEQGKGSPKANLASITSSSKDPNDMSEDHASEAPLSQPSGSLLDSPAPSSGLKICSTLQFSFQDLRARRQQRLARLQSISPKFGAMNTKRSLNLFVAATLELSQPENEERKARALAAATTELERLFRKEDFCRMKVIGQFNLGFIVGKLDEDLFIVDQVYFHRSMLLMRNTILSVWHKQLSSINNLYFGR